MKRIFLVISLLYTLTSFVHAQGIQWLVHQTVNSELALYNVLSIVIDESDNKWFAVPRYGLAKFDGTNWTTYNSSNSGIPNYTIVSIAIDGNGTKWIGTQQGGLATFDDTNWTTYTTANSSIPDNSIFSIAIDKSGTKWIGTGKGLAKFDGTDWTTYNSSNSGLPNNFIRAIAIDGNGNKWIGTSGSGVAKFDGTNWTTYNSSNSGLLSNTIFSIAIDESGTKWFGTAGGLVKFDGTNWTTYRTGNSKIPDDMVYSIVIDKEGNKWIGTGYGGVGKFDDTSWTTYGTSNSNLPDNNVRSLAIDESGTKWIGTLRGVAVYNANGIPNVEASIIFKVSANEVTIDASATSKPLFIIESNIEWTLSSDQSWLTWYVTRHSPRGSYDAEIAITAEANLSAAPRTAVITITGASNKTQSILVTQNGGPTGIPEIESSEFIIFPNPTNGYLKLELPTGMNLSLIEIFSLDGKKVKCKSIINSQNKIDLNDLSAGVYTVKAYTEKGFIVRRLIKQ